MIRRLQDETGSALVTALLATVMMLGLGFALLSIVDTQASESTKERSSDRAFNVSETLLTSQAFVLGRNWPTSAPAGTECDTTGGFGEALGTTTTAPAAITRLRSNLQESYDPADDSAYSGATWYVKLCDDEDADGAGPLAGSTVWEDTILDNPSADVNGNDKLWIVAQATVEGRTRAVTGLVRATTTPALNSRYGLVAGGLADDLGATLNTMTNQGVLGRVLHSPPLGLFDKTATVAPDPTAGAPAPNGITGVRCGALDLGNGSTCVTGTLAATGAIPLVSDLVTGGSLENFPATSASSDDTIGRLRAHAIASGTYTASQAGTAPVTSTSVLNPNNTAPSTAIQPCVLTGSTSPGADKDKVFFIEQVGTSGAANTVGGPGDQYCSIDVSNFKEYKAIVVASGRVVIRGDNTTTPSTNTGVNTFKGVIYALNLQRLPVADGGRGLGDAAAPGREVVRIDRGAHVRGAVNADGKSAKVGIYPPPITINTATLVNSLLCPGLLCSSAGVLTALGLTGAIDGLVNGYCLVPALIGSGCTLRLPALGELPVANGILAQAVPQRTGYGSAITADVAAINTLTVHGDSNLVPGSFRDLQAR